MIYGLFLSLLFVGTTYCTGAVKEITHEPLQLEEAENPEDTLFEFAEVINKLASKIKRTPETLNHLSQVKSYFDDLYLSGNEKTKTALTTLTKDLQTSLFLTAWSAHAKETIMDTLLHQSYNALLNSSSSLKEKARMLKFYKHLRAAIAPIMLGTREKIRRLLPWKTLLILSLVAASGFAAHKKGLWGKIVKGTLAPIKKELHKEVSLAERAIAIGEQLTTQTDTTSGRTLPQQLVDLAGRGMTVAENLQATDSNGQSQLQKGLAVLHTFSEKLPEKAELTRLADQAIKEIGLCRELGNQMSTFASQSHIQEFIAAITGQIRDAQDKFRGWAIQEGLWDTTENTLKPDLRKRWNGKTYIYIDERGGEHEASPHLINELTSTIRDLTTPGSAPMQLIEAITPKIKDGVEINKAFARRFNLTNLDGSYKQGISYHHDDQGRPYYRVPVTHISSTDVTTASVSAEAPAGAGTASLVPPSTSTSSQAGKEHIEIVLDNTNVNFVRIYPPISPFEQLLLILRGSNIKDTTEIASKLFEQTDNFIDNLTDSIAFMTLGINVVGKSIVSQHRRPIALAQARRYLNSEKGKKLLAIAYSEGTITADKMTKAMNGDDNAISTISKQIRNAADKKEKGKDKKEEDDDD